MSYSVRIYEALKPVKQKRMKLKSTSLFKVFIIISFKYLHHKYMIETEPLAGKTK